MIKKLLLGAVAATSLFTATASNTVMQTQALAVEETLSQEGFGDLYDGTETSGSETATTLSLTRSTSTALTWSAAKEQGVELAGYTIIFDMTYVQCILTSGSWSFSLNTNDSSSFSIDISAENYPTYTFTDRYAQNTFATKGGYAGNKVTWTLPSNITTIYEYYSFTPTGMVDSSLTAEEIVDLFITFEKPVAEATENEITITYEVLPAEANDKSVTIELAWEDSTITDDISQYLSFTHDADNSSVTVTMLQKSNNVAKLVITSVDNPEVSAELPINFKQDFLGWSSTMASCDTKTYEVSDSEYILGEEDFKQKILSLSKGFLGTVSIADKAITNMTYELSYANFGGIDGVDIFTSNQYFAYALESRNPSNKQTSSYYVDELGGKLVNMLTDAEKQAIRNADNIQLRTSYTITFDYYGESYSIDMYLTEYIPTSAFAEWTYVAVDSVTTDYSGILF